MSAAVAVLFFRYCRRYKVDKREDRVALMRRIVAKKRASYIPNPKAFIAGKRILIVRGDADEKSNN